MSRAKPSSCVGCPLHSHGSDFSAVTGTGSLGVLCVAEASGEMEAREQRPLVEYAPSGSLLERTFRRMGLSRQQFSLTNTIRCRPRGDWLEGSPWEHEALRHCRPNLDAVIGQRRPRSILALGGVALRELTGMAGEAQGISHLTGYVLRGPNDTPTIGAFHPAFIRRGKSSLQGLFSRNLARAVNVAAGKDRSWIWDIEEAQRDGRLNYTTHPSLDDAWGFARRVTENAGLTVSYDLETFESASIDEDARDGFTDTRIRLIQFSTAAGSGIALPWDGEYKKAAQAILHSSNLKVGWNNWLFDRKVLSACGERERMDLMPRGAEHDGLQCFHHWQPDLPAHLQFAAQFVQFPTPWKHLNGTDLELYSCFDVDATLRLYEFLRSVLEKDGLWGGGALGYVGQVYEVRPVLAAMERRGLPVDDAERLKLDGEFDLAQQELNSEIQGRVPVECRPIGPRRGKSGNYSYGYLRTPACLDGLTLHTCREVTIGPDGEPGIGTVERYVRVEPFNPNSWQQLLLYMDAKGHKRPKSRKSENTDGSPKDTTEKKELIRLANRHGDDFYLKVIEYRELGKMRGTYIQGFAPGIDGRVRGTFTFDTGTGQLAARNPNLTNFPKHVRLAKAIRKMVAAPERHVLIEADYRSYHVLTTGYCAEDADWMRMARLDMHTFVAGCFTGDWKPQIMEESDDALRDRFQWFKSDAGRKRVRDKQAKPSILGVGFGMGARRLYQENLEHFPDEKTARRFLDLLQDLYPRVFEWQSGIRKLAHDQTFLKSPFGHIRRFYEVFVWDQKSGGWKNGDQAEEAVAFLPANIAFGNIRETLKDLRRLGLDEKYQLVNHIHDSFVWCPKREMLGGFMEEVVPVLCAPSKVLKHPVLAPSGLTVDVEVAAGDNWAEMKEVANV